MNSMRKRSDRWFYSHLALACTLGGALGTVVFLGVYAWNRRLTWENIFLAVSMGLVVGGNSYRMGKNRMKLNPGLGDDQSKRRHSVG